MDVKIDDRRLAFVASLLLITTELSNRLVNSKTVYHRNSYRRFRRGFSLIEVVLALGVLSFSSVVMIGLLGVGISSFQTSEQISTSSKIREQVVGDLEEEGWSGVLAQYYSTTPSAWTAQPAAGTPQTFYFDEYGTLLPSTGSTPPGTLFQAVVTPCSPTTSATVGGTGGGPASSTSLIEFTIAISRINVPTTVTGSVTTYVAFVGHN
jgi:uncharacterized protein (TIGR02598 family)